MTTNRKKEMIRLERLNKDSMIELILKDPSVKVLRDGTVWAKRHRAALAGKPVDEEGFAESTISNGNRRSFFYRKAMISVPRLVYRAHVGPLDPSKEITHKDGDSTNNSADNLELLSESMGAGHSLRRFSSDQIIEIRNRRSGGEKLDAIAEDFDTSAIVISKICRGETYLDTGGPITSPGDLETLRGPDNPRTKLNHYDYSQLLKMRQEGHTLSAIAAKYNLSKSGVSRICSKNLERDPVQSMG